MKRLLCIVAVMLAVPFFLTSCMKKDVQNEYFPLQPGNSWTYEARRADMPAPVKLSVKVRKMEKVSMKGDQKDARKVDSYECYVLESFVNDKSETLQREFYARTSEGLAVVKRITGDTELEMDPPELMLKSPLAAGQKWAWNGKVMGTQVDMTFAVEDGGKVNVKDKDLDSLKVTIEQKVQTGETTTTDRWFVKDVGLVKEETLLKKGAKSLSLSTRLIDYELNAEKKL